MPSRYRLAVVKEKMNSQQKLWNSLPLVLLLYKTTLFFISNLFFSHPLAVPINVQKFCLWICVLSLIIPLFMMFALRTGLRLPATSHSDPSSIKGWHIWTPLQKVKHTPGLWEQAPAWTSGRQYSTSMFSNGHQWAFNIFCLDKYLRVCESSLIASGTIHLDAILWMQEMLRSFCKGEKFTWKGRVRVSRCNRKDAGGEKSASKKSAFISCKSVLPFQPIFLMCPHLMPHMFNLNLRQAKDRNTNSVSMTLSCHPQLPQESQICRVTQRHLFWQTKLKCWIHWCYNIKSFKKP